MHPRSLRWFWLGCLFELALLGLAALIGLAVNQSPRANLHWCIRDAAWGFLAAAPLFVLFCSLWTTRVSWAANIRQTLEAKVRPLMVDWSVLQLAIISLLAGVCEEALFRAVLQGALTKGIGTVWALAIASAVFGLFHFVSPAYAIVATLIGAYFGVLWMFTDNLLAPITAHAAYDFAALVYFLRFTKPTATT
jgi:uncharacterized protein